MFRISLFFSVSPSGSPVVAWSIGSWHMAFTSPHRRAAMPSLRTLSFLFCVASRPARRTGCWEIGCPYIEEFKPEFGSSAQRWRFGEVRADLRSRSSRATHVASESSSACGVGTYRLPCTSRCHVRFTGVALCSFCYSSLQNLPLS